jgi:hypothetical protein
LCGAQDYEGNNGSYDGSAIECGSIPLFGATVFPRSGDGHPFGFSVTTAVRHILRGLKFD